MARSPEIDLSCMLIPYLRNWVSLFPVRLLCRQVFWCCQRCGEDMAGGHQGLLGRSAIHVHIVEFGVQIVVVLKFNVASLEASS